MKFSNAYEMHFQRKHARTPASLGDSVARDLGLPYPYMLYARNTVLTNDF